MASAHTKIPPSLPAMEQSEGGEIKARAPKKHELPKKPQKIAQPEKPQAENAGENFSYRAKLASKIVKLMDEVSNIPKDAVNTGEGWRYLSSDGLLRKINPACVKLGLATTISTELIDWREKQTVGGKIWQICAVKVSITITDQDTGYSLTTEGIGGGQSSGATGFASAQTQARKYALMLALNIDTGDDPEGDEESDAADSLPAQPVGTDGKRVKCAYCDDGVAYYLGLEDVCGKKVKRYFCGKCKKETRVEA